MVLFICNSICNGQVVDGPKFDRDSTNAVLRDSARLDAKARKVKFIPIPRRAALLSAVLPGAGQFYNRRYWKIPILYAGIGALAYFINFNSTEYDRFKNAYILRIKGDNTSASLFQLYTKPEQLGVIRDYYRRNRDLLVIVSALTYLINIADASVDAHLSTFNVTDDLQLSLAPKIHNIRDFSGNGLGAIAPGMALTINFRK